MGSEMRRAYETLICMIAAEGVKCFLLKCQAELGHVNNLDLKEQVVGNGCLFRLGYWPAQS